MAPQNQAERSFDPSRDIDNYLTGDSEALRQRGLQKQSIRLYELLCRLCLPGEAQLVYRQQADLANDLKRFAPDDDGLTEGSVSRKLNRLADLGFLSKAGGGQSSGTLVIELHMPELVKLKAPRQRHPKAAVTPAVDLQGQLFGGGGHLRLVGGDESLKAQPLAVSKAQPLALSRPQSATACALGADRATEDTSYTRARTVDVVVDVVDVVETTSKEDGGEEKRAADPAAIAAAEWPVTEEEFRRAENEGYQPLLELWRGVGLRQSPDKAQAHEDRWIALRTHILLQRSVITEADWAAAVSAPIEYKAATGSVNKPFSQFNVCLKRRIPGFWKILPKIRPPVDLLLPHEPRATKQPSPSPEEREEIRRSLAAAAKQLGLAKLRGLARPEVAPDGEHPQLE